MSRYILPLLLACLLCPFAPSEAQQSKKPVSGPTKEVQTLLEHGQKQTGDEQLATFEAAAYIANTREDEVGFGTVVYVCFQELGGRLTPDQKQEALLRLLEIHKKRRQTIPRFIADIYGELGGIASGRLLRAGDAGLHACRGKIERLFWQRKKFERFLREFVVTMTLFIPKKRL